MDKVQKPARVSRALVRQLLRQLLPTDPLQEAFCLDYFPDVQCCFSAGMDRLSKTNLLLESVEPAQVFSRLSMHCGRDRLNQELGNITPTSEISHGLEADAFRDQLDALLLVRAQRQAMGQPTADLDMQISQIKRDQRQKPQLREGEVLMDKYRLIEVIGKGGFAKVWQAFNLESKQFVAVKVLHSDQAEDRSRRERFHRGAKQLRDLRHPHIVRVLDSPKEEAGFHYFIMDFLGGGDLQRAVLQDGLSCELAVRAVLEAGEALIYTHARGLIHRDVKPQNILLDSAGNAFLTDFDLVWAADSTGGTRTGAMGTYLYASPEALEDASRIDARADVYSIGMTLLLVLSGRPLPAHVVHNRQAFINRLSVPSSVKELLLAATALDPQDRIRTMSELCARIEGVLLDKTPVHLPMTQAQPPAQSQPPVPSFAAKSSLSASENTISFPKQVPTPGGTMNWLNPGEVMVRESESSGSSRSTAATVDYKTIRPPKQWSMNQRLVLIFGGATIGVLSLLVILLPIEQYRARSGASYPKETTIDSNKLAIPLVDLNKAIEARLVIRGMPGSRVLIDFKDIGIISLSGELAYIANTPGTDEWSVHLKVIKDGHAEFSARLLLKAGGTQAVQAEQPVQAPVLLTIATRPPGAYVIIDGEEKGMSPVRLNHMSGLLFHLELRKKGFESYSEDLQPEKDLNVDIKLDKERHRGKY